MTNMKLYKCPKCGEEENLHFNYNYSQAHRPVEDVTCNECGETFDGDMKISELIKKIKEEKHGKKVQ